jgi:hypothetical protein
MSYYDDTYTDAATGTTDVTPPFMSSFGATIVFLAIAGIAFLIIRKRL